MDGQRFDGLARQIAGAAPRRSLLRAAAAAAATALVAQLRGISGVSAQEGTLPPGASCTSATQCSQAGGTTACADNGYADDPFNCCRYEGGACFDTEYSADCCSGLYCRDGVCTDLSATGDLPPGSYCTATEQCSQESGPTVCSDNGTAADGERNCCLLEGGSCGTLDSRCCGNFSCVDGVCRASGASATPTPESGGDVAPGGECTTSSQCSGSAICADNGLASDGPLNCCLGEVESCSADAECCAGLICGDNYISADGPLNCCAPLGGRCSSDAACCDFNYCIEGTCQPLDE